MLLVPLNEGSANRSMRQYTAVLWTDIELLIEKIKYRKSSFFNL